MTKRYAIFAVFVCALAAVWGGHDVAAAGKKQTPQKAGVVTQQIMAVVNEDVISEKDLRNRMQLIMASSGLPNTDEIRARLAPQMLSALIEEQLMLQEAHKSDIVVTPQEIDAGYATIAQQNKMQGEQFKAMLQKGGIDLSTMSRQIEAQVAWGKVVQQKLHSRVVVSDRDVDEAIARLTSKIGTPEYLAAEIFLPVDGAKQEGEARQLAQRLVAEIKGGKASFFRLAQQFSKTAGSANNGGDTGWLSADQVAEEILPVLKKLAKNQVSDPIRTKDGIYIVLLRETRTLTKAAFPTREQVYNGLGTQRLDRLQRRYLMDIKAAAFVDIRA